MNNRIEQLKQHFQEFNTWLGLQGCLPLCAGSLSSASSTHSTFENAAVKANRYLQKGEIAIRQDPHNGRWMLSGTIYLKKAGRLLFLLSPDGLILPLEIRASKKLEFSGWELPAKISPASIRFVLDED
jgi:hypothetical protein